MTKEEANGIRMVQGGKILNGTYETIELVNMALMAMRKGPGKNKYTFEMIGTAGNYKIIRRDRISTISRYVN